jgi:hypothetical protein
MFRAWRLAWSGREPSSAARRSRSKRPPAWCGTRPCWGAPWLAPNWSRSRSTGGARGAHAGRRSRASHEGAATPGALLGAGAGERLSLRLADARRRTSRRRRWISRQKRRPTASQNRPRRGQRRLRQSAAEHRPVAGARRATRDAR